MALKQTICAYFRALRADDIIFSRIDIPHHHASGRDIIKAEDGSITFYYGANMIFYPWNSNNLIVSVPVEWRDAVSGRYFIDLEEFNENLGRPLMVGGIHEMFRDAGLVGPLYYRRPSGEITHVSFFTETDAILAVGVLHASFP